MSGYSGDFHSLKKHLLQEKRLFVDQDFPPNNSSLRSSSNPSESRSTTIEWKRPMDIVRMRDPKSQPKFVTGDFSRFDPDQGKLGDCWFVSAVALLVDGPRDFFERVVPLDQSFDTNSYAGIFRFNFWQYGYWTEVVIDDFLPTDGRQLIYCRNREEPDEFWCALLEKAYAKLNGNYEALGIGGFVASALVDLTGGVAELVKISKMHDANTRANFFETILKTTKMNTLYGANINKQEGVPLRRNGLVTGHNYSITGIARVPYQENFVKLLRIRNPHGRKEWQGPWSDKSMEMRIIPKDVKEKLKLRPKDDGEFWISLNDFVENFDDVHMCHLKPDSIGRNTASGKLNWNVIEHHGAWVKGFSAGGSGHPPDMDLWRTNPRFHLHLENDYYGDTENNYAVIVSLMEKEKNDARRVAIGFQIFKVFNRRRLIYEGSSGPYRRYREVVKRFQLSPGYYLIIPSTYKPNQEAKFLLRIFTEKQA